MESFKKKLICQRKDGLGVHPRYGCDHVRHDPIVDCCYPIRPG
jgi:hypothetical protein